MDVFSGEVHCTTTARGAAVSVPAACGAALAAAGLTLRREVSGCSLASMACGMAREEEMATLLSRDPSMVRVSLERLNVSRTDGTRFSLVRDLIDRPLLVQQKHHLRRPTAAAAADWRLCLGRAMAASPRGRSSVPALEGELPHIRLQHAASASQA